MVVSVVQGPEMSVPRILALDVGQKTIGLAVSDEMGIAAHPHGVIARHSRDRDIGAVLAAVDQLGAKAVVIGLPLELSGRQGIAAKRSQQVGGWLAQSRPGLNVAYWDERFSTSEATRVLISGGVRREQRKAVIDQQAAVVILQGYLDQLRAQ